MLNAILVLVSFVMTLINIITSEHVLAVVTFVFAVLCIVNFFLSIWMKKIDMVAYVLFAVEVFALMAFFIVTGIPNGFSILWSLFVPCFAMIVFGAKTGVIFSLIQLAFIILMFWTPVGEAVLQYQYTEEFMLRFPIVYITCMITGLFIELIRQETQRQLIESEEKYIKLYRHDALTGVYNRYGFYEDINEKLRNGDLSQLAGCLILDIDDFKKINDLYGHAIGDEILKHVASAMQEVFCEHTVYCRWGGEEFAAFLTCEHDHLEYAERLRQRIEQQEYEIDGVKIKVTVSIGLCLTKSADNFPVDRHMIIADNCLYRAKREGKNRVICEKLYL